MSFILNLVALGSIIGLSIWSRKRWIKNVAIGLAEDRAQRLRDRLDAAGVANGLEDAVRKAATVGDVAALSDLVAANGGPAVRLDADPQELTALHWAAASGSVEAVKLLLAPPVEADPRATRSNNFTPLHSAAMQGHAAVCEVLLMAGAEIDVQTNPQGYAPLHSAAFAGHVDAIRVLLAGGADRGLVNYRGERPADTARRTGQAEAVRTLEAGSNV